MVVWWRVPVTNYSRKCPQTGYTVTLWHSLKKAVTHTYSQLLELREYVQESLRRQLLLSCLGLRLTAKSGGSQHCVAICIMIKVTCYIVTWLMTRVQLLVNTMMRVLLLLLLLLLLLHHVFTSFRPHYLLVVGAGCCMYTCMPVCLYACMHIYIHAYMHTCMYAYMHVCKHAYMHKNVPPKKFPVKHNFQKKGRGRIDWSSSAPSLLYDNLFSGGLDRVNVIVLK